MLRIFREMVANTHEMPTKHSARRRDRFIASVSLHYQIHIFVSPNTYLTIIEYTYSFHHTRVFTLSNMRFHSSFRGCLRICGHDKSAPTAACGLPKCCKQYAYNATFTHEMPTKHTARRRGRFIAPVSLYYQIYIFISPNTHFRFIIHEYSHYQICVSVPRFVGVYVYAGTINRPLRLLTDCHFAANGLQ